MYQTLGTFRITLPVQQAGSIEPTAESWVETDGIIRGHVLLVEDDELVRGTYTDALTLHGHQVTAVPSGNRALEVFGEGGIEIVVTDLSMAGISGLDVAREIDRLDPSVPVILISDWAVRQDEEKFKRAGVDFVLAKPCLIEHLLGTVQQALRLRVNPAPPDVCEPSRT